VTNILVVMGFPENSWKEYLAPHLKHVISKV